MASDVCASVGHPYVSLFAYWCPHRSEWVVHFDHSSDTSDVGRQPTHSDLFTLGGLVDHQEVEHLLGACLHAYFALD